MANEAAADWNGDEVRRLRGYLGDTQAELAARLGTRQQTVSEWETGSSHPRRMARRLLHLLAEERGFYSADGSSPDADHVAGPDTRETAGPE